MKTRGRCGCGAVTFEVDGEPRWQGYCHCRSCQIAHAAPVVAGAIFPKEAVQLTGSTAVVKVTDEKRATQRLTCQVCGTKVLNAPHPNVYLVIPALCEDGSWFEPQSHLYWSARAIDIADDLPKYLDFPKEFGGSGKTADPVMDK